MENRKVPHGLGGAVSGPPPEAPPVSIGQATEGEPYEGHDPTRLGQLRDLGNARGSEVIAWLTGDRPGGLETQIAFEQVGVLYDHLTAIGPQKQIDLLLYSRGGLTLAGFAAVNLIREFCDRFNVLVPYRAMSCATLITLGADEIVMGRLGQLSPVDPSINSPYNPPAPQIPGVALGQPRFLPLSVEDVVAYAELAKNEFKLKEEASMIRVLESLASKIHPIALGNVQRSRTQIQMLATKLLASRKAAGSEAQVKKVVQVVTRELGSHDYIISRREARDELGLPVTFPSAEVENRMWRLFKSYEREMQLTTPYNQEALLGPLPQATIVFRRAFVESAPLTSIYETERNVSRVQMMTPQGIQAPGFQEQVLREAWVTYPPQAP